jgi:hypothetical protein
MENREYDIPADTNKRIVETLLKAKAARTRIRIQYEDNYSVIGYVGNSTGTKPILILVHNSRSFGGAAISFRGITDIRESAGGKYLYRKQWEIDGVAF